MSLRIRAHVLCRHEPSNVSLRSDGMRRSRPPCRLDTAADWRAVFVLGHGITSAVGQSPHADRDPRRETSSCRYRYRPRRLQNSAWVTWRAPCLWCPLASFACWRGRSTAVPSHCRTRPRRRARCNRHHFICRILRLAAAGSLWKLLRLPTGHRAGDGQGRRSRCAMLPGSCG